MKKIRDLIIKGFDKFYELCSVPKIRFYFHLIYGILAIHLSVYAVALARYEFAVFTLDTKVATVTSTYNDKNNLSLSRIVSLSKEKIPVKPAIYDILSSSMSLLPYFDKEQFENCQELSYLLSYNKNNISGVNLKGFKFCGAKLNKSRFFLEQYKEEGADFTNSNFNNVNLSSSILRDNLFQYSKFYSVEFSMANMYDSDFAFSIFDNCILSSANLMKSNLCGSKFTNIKEIWDANFSYTNLISADLSSLSLEKLTSINLNNAYYNSKILDLNSAIYSDEQFHFISKNFPSCLYMNPKFLSTKFPKGFDPEAHGMIDISKW